MLHAVERHMARVTTQMYHGAAWQTCTELTALTPICPPPHRTPLATPDLARRISPNDAQTNSPGRETDAEPARDGPHEPLTEPATGDKPHTCRPRSPTAASPDWLMSRSERRHDLGFYLG